MNSSFLINYFVSLLVICSPFSALPALLGLSRGRSIAEKRKTGIVASMATGIILIVVTWIGGPLLDFFGISIYAFQLAGGIVVFLLALSMLKAEQSRIKQASEDDIEAQKKDSIAVVPLAIPIMAGPGAISTVIVAANNYPGFVHQIQMSFCALLVACILGFVLFFAGTLERYFGQSGINIINRIGGLILASIAIQTLAKGAIGLFPGLVVHS